MTDLNPHENPVQTYLHISQKVSEGAENNQEYPQLELCRDFARLMVACSSLITQNASLSTRTADAEALAEELTVEMFHKDMEIYELNEKITEKDTND